VQLCYSKDMDADNKMERTVASYDFTRHLGNWFDMWHTHLDWYGHGTDNPVLRQKYLLETIKTFDAFCSQLEQYPHPFQAWILVDLVDSSEDAIYIHSPDPHSDSPFPFAIGLTQQKPADDDVIGRLFIDRNFVLYTQPQDTSALFFARPGVGLPLA
jgi:hypothetical protein